MYRYDSPLSGWTACLPLAIGLVIDSLDADPNYGGLEIQGGPMVFTERSRAKALEERNAWISSGAIGEEPIDQADTAMRMRNFSIASLKWDSVEADYHNTYYDQTLDEQKKGKERSLKGKASSESDEAWPVNRVTTLVNSHGKGFVRTLQYGVYSDPEKGTIAVANLTVEHYGLDRVLSFQGMVATRDTTCGLECMEKDTTIMLYDRIIDSVDW
ncbi:MAG: hypothetical protein IPP83_00065 [Flavobacteriales bacterium]|nr:hypothetical protein [Flavobacteriales bacterium]